MHINYFSFSFFLTGMLLFCLVMQSNSCGKRRGNNANTKEPANSSNVYLNQNSNQGASASLTDRNSQLTYRQLYHGVHPGSANGAETTVDETAAYLEAIGDDPQDGGNNKLSFVYFSQEFDENWLKAPEDDPKAIFPYSQVVAIESKKAVPFIRLMTRTTTETNDINDNVPYKEKWYSYDVLLGESTDAAIKEKAEKFRKRILTWGRAAKAYGKPIYVEWGTEVNGKWFWWNAFWNGYEQCKNERRLENCLAKYQDGGPTRFRRAFARLRHLINDEGGATNVRWALHVASSGDPNLRDDRSGKSDWNRIQSYYPATECRGMQGTDASGDCVDLVGVSVYGAQSDEEKCYSFRELLREVLPEPGENDADSLKFIGKNRELFVLEMGATLWRKNPNESDAKCNAAAWANEAFTSLFNLNEWKDYNVKGFSWWNEAWLDTEENRRGEIKVKQIVDMRLQSFELCSVIDDESIKNQIKCDCWRSGSPTSNNRECRNLKGKRQNLRNVFVEMNRKYGAFLIKPLGE